MRFFHGDTALWKRKGNTDNRHRYTIVSKYRISLSTLNYNLKTIQPVRMIAGRKASPGLMFQDRRAEAFFVRSVIACHHSCSQNRANVNTARY